MNLKNFVSKENTNFFQPFWLYNPIAYVDHNIITYADAETLWDNEWHHYTATITGSECIIYVDGEVNTKVTLREPILFSGLQDVSFSLGQQLYSHFGDEVKKGKHYSYYSIA